MTHRNSPLTPAGRLRLVQRVEDDGRPIAHVAAEAGVARSTLTNWVHRSREYGIAALAVRTTAPALRRSRLPIEVLVLIDAWRRDRKSSARRIALVLGGRGHHYCVRTIGRWLQRFGISRRRDLDATGENKDRKSTRLNSSHVAISYAVFCLQKKSADVLSNEDTSAAERGDRN